MYLHPFIKKFASCSFGAATVLTVVFITSFTFLLNPQKIFAASQTTPTLPDCSQFMKLPTNWGAQTVAAIKALKSTANPTSAWAITFNVTQQPASNNFVLTGWATANISRGSTTRSMWYTHDATDPRKVMFNIDSSKGDVYRLIGIVHADGTVGIGEISGTLYDVAWAKTVNVPTQCAFLNHQVPVADLTGPLYWDLSYTAPLAQDVNLGFFDPPASTSGSSGSSNGLTSAELTTVLATFGGIFIAGFITYKIVMAFRFRRVF